MNSQEDLGSEIEEEPNEHLTKETSGLDKSDMGVSATKDGVDFEGLTGVSSSSSITRTVGFQLVDFSVLCFFLDGIVSGVDRSMVSFWLKEKPYPPLPPSSSSSERMSTEIGWDIFEKFEFEGSRVLSFSVKAGKEIDLTKEVCMIWGFKIGVCVIWGLKSNQNHS